MTKKEAKPWVRVECQYTGYEFEAPNRKSKIHPVLNVVTQEAFTKKVSTSELYSVAREGAALGLPIEEIAENCRERIAEVLAYRENRIEAYHKERADRAEAHRQRVAQNELLKKHGYTWHRIGFESEEDADIGNFNNYMPARWQLYDANDKPVTLQEAMAAIKQQ